MEYSCKRLRAKKSVALNDQKQVEKLNKIKNISTEEVLYGLQMKDHSLQPSALDIICKMSTRRKRASSVSKENTRCKGIKLSDEIKKKSICTMSKKEESLLGKIKRMIGEQMDILNSDFINQKLESLNRRVEQLHCKNDHEEIVKALLKKVSKLKRRIDAVIAFQEGLFSKMAVHQTMLPSAGNPSTVLNGLGPSAFFPDIVNTPTSSSNTLLLSPYTGVTSAHFSEYIRCSGSAASPVLKISSACTISCWQQQETPEQCATQTNTPSLMLSAAPILMEVTPVSMENQKSASATIPNNQMSTQAEMPARVQDVFADRSGLENTLRSVSRGGRDPKPF